jgi:uncharacterized protein YsxB (DUF464 family)
MNDGNRMIVVRHKTLERLSHYANIVSLSGLVASGFSMYLGLPYLDFSDAYANHIICAAVSAVTQTVLGGLHEVAGLNPKVVRDDDQGFLSVDLGSDVTNDAAQVILATMVAGLRAIAEQNPRYVKIKDLTSD